MMQDITRLIDLIDLLAAHTGRAATTISRLVSGSGGTIHRLRDGSGITIARYDRIVRRLDEIWPEDLDWPDEIVRPHQPPTETAI